MKFSVVTHPTQGFYQEYCVELAEKRVERVRGYPGGV